MFSAAEDSRKRGSSKATSPLQASNMSSPLQGPRQHERTQGMQMLQDSVEVRGVWTAPSKEKRSERMISAHKHSRSHSSLRDTQQRKSPSSGPTRNDTQRATSISPTATLLPRSTPATSSVGTWGDLASPHVRSTANRTQDRESPTAMLCFQHPSMSTQRDENMIRAHHLKQRAMSGQNSPHRISPGNPSKSPVRGTEASANIAGDVDNILKLLRPAKTNRNDESL